MSNEEEVEMELEFVDNEEEVIEEDTRLQKSIKRLIKITKIDKEKLKGLTSEEQFDRLEFLVENLPKKTKSKKDKNKPIVPLPIDVDSPKFGRMVKNAAGGNYWLFKIEDWIGNKNKKK